MILFSISLEEEDFREIDDADTKQIQINGAIPNHSSNSQKDETNSRSILSDEINPTKEDGSKMASVINSKPGLTHQEGNSNLLKITN